MAMPQQGSQNGSKSGAGSRARNTGGTRRDATTRGMLAASACAKDALRAAAGRRGIAEARLITHWPEIAGEDLAVGGYRLEFAIGDHFEASGLPVTDPPFLDVVVIDFAVSNTEQHWHVPLLVSPYGYSTYRGS